jgi:omega-hydroxy-beta-dihydromenaquinone-9 sulfotransferase
MFVNLSIFFKALYITLFKRPFSLRRWFWVLLFSVVFWLTWCLIAIGRMLDHIFFADFKKQEIKEPIFIVGTPRSGTSYTQSLLCLDKEQFAYLNLYQTIFPAVFFQRVYDLAVWIDGHSGRIFSRTISWVERKFLGAWDDRHYMALNHPEEDEALFLFCLMSESIFMLFPYINELWEVAFPDTLPEKQRRKLMRYYKSCIQRHLYATGQNKIFLSKSTSFAGRIDSMLEFFPDARVIHLVRHPYQTIPSHISLFHQSWRLHSPEIAKDSPECEAYAMVAVQWYLNMLEKQHEFESSRYIRIAYPELAADPEATIEKIYKYFDLPMSDKYKARLQAFIEHSRNYKSKHVYTLEEYGLSKAWIQRQLGVVLDAYGFEY